MTDSVRVPSEPGSQGCAPEPQGVSAEGADPSRVPACAACAGAAFDAWLPRYVGQQDATYMRFTVDEMRNAFVSGHLAAYANPAAVDAAATVAAARPSIMLEMAAADGIDKLWEHRWRSLVQIYAVENCFKDAGGKWGLRGFLDYAGRACGFVR